MDGRFLPRPTRLQHSPSKAIHAGALPNAGTETDSSAAALLEIGRVGREIAGQVDFERIGLLLQQRSADALVAELRLVLRLLRRASAPGRTRPAILGRLLGRAPAPRLSPPRMDERTRQRLLAAGRQAEALARELEEIDGLIRLVERQARCLRNLALRGHEALRSLALSGADGNDLMERRLDRLQALMDTWADAVGRLRQVRRQGRGLLEGYRQLQAIVVRADAVAEAGSPDDLQTRLRTVLEAFQASPAITGGPVPA